MTIALTSEDSQNAVTREGSTFLRDVLEQVGSSSLRDAAMSLYPGGLVAPTPKEALRYVLCVAAAVLCDSASVRLTSEPVPSAPTERVGPIEVAQSAARAIAAIERASLDELTEAHSYFLAPPWSQTMVAERPLLADLSFGVMRIMIDCARQWSNERLAAAMWIEPQSFNPTEGVLGDFEAFLQGVGLTRLPRDEAVDPSGIILQYHGASIGVRLVLNKGAWLVEVADVRSRPDRWYPAAILRDLLSGAREDVLSLPQQIDIVRAKWQEILRVFDPMRQADTQMRLAFLRSARAKSRSAGG